MPGRKQEVQLFYWTITLPPPSLRAWTGRPGPIDSRRRRRPPPTGPREAPLADIEDGDGLLSIGDLAGASGISTDTLRAWERRYGRPEPVRLPSGHRRYRSSDVPWLRRVAEALSRGHRAGAVVALPPRALDSLLSGGGPPEPDAGVAALLALLRRMRGDALDRALRRDARRLGPREFLLRRASPLLEAAGRAWADGRIEVRHEHYLSEILEDRLRTLRSALPLPAGAPAAVLATLPGEQHGLGLQMAAVVCALAGVRPVVLGVNTPLPDIAAAAVQGRARAVLVGVSLATGGVATDRMLSALRASLPARIPLVVGGAGARGPRRGPRGIEFVEGLEGLERRLPDLAGATIPA